MVDCGDNSLIGSNNRGVNGERVDLLNLAPGSLQINHTPENGKLSLSTALFSIAPLASPGNSPRRPFYGPGIKDFDMAFLKETPLWSEKSMFRRGTFNTFNHPRFFGVENVNGNINSSTFGQVVSAAPPRIMRLANG